MLGVERVHDAAVHLDRLPCDELTDPAGQVLIRVRDVIDDHRHRPGVAGQARGAEAHSSSLQPFTKPIIRSLAASMSAAYAAGSCSSPVTKAAL